MLGLFEVNEIDISFYNIYRLGFIKQEEKGRLF